MTRSWMGHSFIGANNNGQMEGFGRFTHSDGTAYEGNKGDSKMIKRVQMCLLRLHSWIL